jgi:hypothetical protein
MMFGLKWSSFATVAILAALGFQCLAWGQSQSPPVGTTGGTIATPQFRPLTEADARDALAQTKAAAAAVDQRFANAGPSGDGWKEYLSWDQFKAELLKAKPDNTVLANTYGKLAAGHEGLELKWFADLRVVLGNYLQVAASVGNADLAAAFNTQIAELTQQIKSLKDHPTTDETRTIANHLLWLETARQAPELIRDVHQRFSAPNFHVQIGGDLLQMGAGGPIDDVAPIDDVILGTVVHGTGRTVGQTRTLLTPNPTFATFDVLLDAVNSSNNIGRNGPVCIYSTGQTCLAANKRMWLDQQGLHAHPARASAEAHTTITNIVSIKGRKMVERFAWRRAGTQLSQAETIASEHAACRLGARVDSQADPSIQKANEQYEAKGRKPLDERRAFPRSLSFDTLASALEIHGAQASDSQLAAPSAPPELTRPADISVRIHESMVNNSAETVFTGMRLNDGMVQRTATELLGSLPEQLKNEQNQEPFTIVFPPENARVSPITVSFGDNGFAVTLRGQEYFTGDQRRPGMNITATYKFVKTPEGYRAVRQGDLQIYGYGQVPGAKRSLRQQGIYTVLQAKFGKIFGPDIKLQGFKFKNEKLAAAGQLAPQEIIAQNGWLAIGYCRQK